MGTTDGSPAPGRVGRGRARHALAPPRRRLLVLGAVGVVVAVLMTVTLVRLTGGGATPSVGPPTAAPTSAGSSPEAPGQATVPRGAGPAAAPGDAGGDGAGSEVCPPFPRFPDESCTGYQHTGVTLRPCPNVITEDGATFDGCRFGPDLEVQASDVTITRSLVEGTVYATHLTDWSLGNLRLVDVEIDGGQKVVDGRSAAIGNDDYTCIRCQIHGSERGANLGRNVHIEESYLHGWYHTPGAHQTAIGSNGGSNFTIVHNTLECESVGDACSAALALYPDFEPVDDVLVQHNLLNTNGGFCTYGGFDEGTNIRYIDNIFGDKFYETCGIWGPVAAFESSAAGNVWRGNTFPDGSEVVPKADI